MALTESGRSLRPMNGTEYLDSLRDEREVWIYGERVKDVTTHPAFRNAARTLARLYDSLHEPSQQEVLTAITDTGSGGYTHKFFKTPRSAAELYEARNAIATWARMTYGWMGRCPDYKSSFLGTLATNAEFYQPYDANARRWYQQAQEKVLFFNHAIINPPVDRNRSPDENRDIFVHVETETDQGLIISGAKVVATGSALTNYTFVGQYTTIPGQRPDMAVMFIVPTGAPGVKLFSRPSYAMAAEVLGSPFDYPLSSRFDENDAIMVFDNVLVPWEDVLIYRDAAKVNDFFSQSGFAPRAFFHGCIRFAVKLDFIAGLLLKCVKAVGSDDFRGVQVQVGEVFAWRNLFWSLADSMANQPTPWKLGAVLPNVDYAMTYRALAPLIYPKLKDIIENTLASSLIYVPSHAVDFEVPDIRKYLDRFVRGSGSCTALERVKLMKLMWDAIGTEFGGRHELYERNYGGNHENVRLEVLFTAISTGVADQCNQLVEQCLAEYDVKGWTTPELINSVDVNLVMQRFKGD